MKSIFFMGAERRLLQCTFRLVNISCSRIQLCHVGRTASVDAKLKENADEELACELRRVPRTRDEFTEQKRMTPVQPVNPRFLRVAVIGDPNAGKSTLTNKLTGWRVCSVSSKVHTTRRSSSTVLNIDDTQLEFTDTPGTLNFEKCMQHNIENNFVNEPDHAAKRADVLLAVVDVSNIYTRYNLSNEVKALLEKHRDKQSALVLNKIDSVCHRTALMKVARKLCNGVVQGKEYGTEVKEELILPSDTALKKHLLKKMEQRMNPTNKTANLTGWSYFSNVFMVSAATGEGVSTVLEHLLKIAPSRQWRYHSSVVVIDNPQELATRVIREKLLDSLEKEIGYKIRIQIDSWEVNEADLLRISAILKCPKKNIVSIVIGPAGKSIFELSKNVQQELCNVFRCEVQAHLAVKYDRPV